MKRRGIGREHFVEAIEDAWVEGLDLTETVDYVVDTCDFSAHTNRTKLRVFIWEQYAALEDAQVSRTPWIADIDESDDW